MHGKDDVSDKLHLSPIHKVLERAPSMLAYWDTNLRCRFANKAYETWFGVDAHGLVGTLLNDLLGPELFALNETYVRAALRGEAQSFQRMVPGPDGVRRHSLAHYLPDIVDGQVQGFVVQVTDVSTLKDIEATLRAEAVERERAGHLLRKSEAALKKAQRLVRIGSWHWEVCPDISSWSDELYRIFGRDPSRLPPSYAEHAQLYSPHSWLALQAAVARTLSVGEPYALELEYVRPDGATGWVEARGEAERDDQGTIIGLHGTAQEITARRDARLVQRQLATSEHFRERLEALTPGVVHIFDLEQQRNVYISRSVAALLGYSPAEGAAMGTDVLATLMHPDDRLRFPEHLERIRRARDDETADFEFRMRNRAGAWIWFQSRDAVFSRDDSGAVRELIGTAIDIDSRKQAEEALRESEQRFRIMADGLPLLVWVHDAPGDLQFINQTYCEFFGVTAEQITGQNWQPLVHPDDVAAYAGEFVACVQARRPFHAELRVRRVDGEWRWMESRARPRLSSSGEFLGMVGCTVDITENKLAEQELRAAKAEAERANSAKSLFLASASHDLRQPLQALGLYVNALKSHVAATGQPLLANLSQCISSLSALLNNLLELSKLQAGVVTPRPGTFAVAETFATLQAVYAPEAQLKGLRLRFVDCGQLTADTDPVLYRRMLGNLIDNAIRYTGRGGVLVGCRRRQQKTWVEVRDSGPGIAPEAQAEVFEEFKQLGDGARNRGSGLGLAIVARTAALLGLQVDLRSRPGRGSVFAIELPPGQPGTIDATVRPQGVRRALRIALVDDNAMVRQSLADALSASGHHVLATSTGAELRAELPDAAPEILICDYRLPQGQTGYDVIAATRAIFDPDLPAIIITGDADPQLVRSMADRGIVVLHKPFDIETLAAYLEDLT